MNYRKEMELDLANQCSHVCRKTMPACRIFLDQVRDIFFSLLNINSDFLLESVEYWPKNCSYIEVKHTVDALYVVNDAAERGVKLCAVFF